MSVVIVGQTITLTVDDPRPLALAVSQIEGRFGWVVTYEDPRYLYAGDSRDVTEAVVRNYRSGQPRVIVPRGGLFSFVAPATTPSSLAGEQEVLQALLHEYALSGYPGKYVLRHTGSVFHVVPTATRNAKGEEEPYGSFLDKRISQVAGTRTAIEAVQGLASQVGLEIGRMPMPMFWRST